LQAKYDAGSNSFAADTTAAVLEAVKGVGAGDDGSGGGPSEKQLKQMAMPFAKYKMDEAMKAGGQVRGWTALLVPLATKVGLWLVLLTVQVAAWLPWHAPPRVFTGTGFALLLSSL
jgi:hypothetical protein